MPNKPAAEKYLRKTKKLTERSKEIKRKLEYLVKRVRRSAQTQSNTASKFFQEAARALDRATQKGIIKKNTAARLKSRLAQTLRRSAEKKK